MEIKFNAMQLTTATKNIIVLKVNIIDVQDLYTENYKQWLTEINTQINGDIYFHELEDLIFLRCQLPKIYL